MSNLKFKIFLSVVLVMTTSKLTNGQGGVSRNEGVVPIRELPSKQISEELVMLRVPHIRQKPGNCVPTSCAMVLRYFGESTSPVGLKKLAENHKPADQRNTEFTYWKDMQYALQQKGKTWTIERFEKTSDGFEKGFNKIKHSLLNDLPVVVEIHQEAGHSLVVIGFDDSDERIFLRDPLTESSKARVLSYKQFESYWHNHKYGNNRSVFFPQRSTKENKKIAG